MGKRVFLGVFAALFGLLLQGCAMMAAESVAHSRLEYNVAIEKTNNDQLLLNLVRLQYRDTPFFMKTTSVATSFAFEAGTKGTVNILPTDNTYAIAPHFSYTEKPTVTYVPLHGEDFVKQMLSPLDLSTLLLLYHSGWSIERLLRLTAQSLNDVVNAPSASGPTPSKEPEYKTFLELASIIRKLQKKSALSMGQDSEQRSVVNIHPDYQQHPDTALFKQLLKLDPQRNQYYVVAGIGSDPKGATIFLNLRSMLASMFYLSQAIDVVPQHRKEGRVTNTETQSGEPFDWSNVTGGLFRVESSDSAPTGAYAAVKYRGKWFYIDDSDLTSKSTFSLMTQLLALQSGNTKTEAPVLTIPVQ